MRFLGLDIGEKTIGVAVSDELGWTAQGLTTIQRTSIRKDIEEVLRLAETYNVKGIVVGMPLRFDGSASQQTYLVHNFIERLTRDTDTPVHTWDERLSTVAVERVLIDADMSRKRRKKVVDKLAAAYILQGYLESQRRPDHTLEESF